MGVDETLALCRRIFRNSPGKGVRREYDDDFVAHLFEVSSFFFEGDDGFLL